MGKSVKFAEVYLRFIQMSEALRDQHDLPQLEPLEERILMIIAMARQTRERLSVKDLMSMSELGSPAMLLATGVFCFSEKYPSLFAHRFQPAMQHRG